MTQDRPAHEARVVTKLSPRPVADTAARLTSMISAKGIKLFAVIDQAAEARQAGLELRDTTLVIFGSPAAGTPLMAAAPLAALDPPPKVLTRKLGPDRARGSEPWPERWRGPGKASVVRGEGRGAGFGGGSGLAGIRAAG